MIEYLWLIPGFPLAAFILIGVFLRRMPKISAWTSIASVIVSLGFSIWAIITVIQHNNQLEHTSRQVVEQMNFAWITIGDISIELGILLDPLTAIMLGMITFVGLLILIYSQGYMHGDPGYSRYFAFMSLFMASMLTLVLANNFLLLYMAWELVGLCSDWILVSKTGSGSSRKKSLLGNQIGRYWLVDWHNFPIHQYRHIELFRS